MSAPAHLARRALARTPAPLLRNGNAYSTLSRPALLAGSSSARLAVGWTRTRTHLSAVAIPVPIPIVLVRIRSLSTEPNRVETSDPLPPPPPPGFNIEAAKKPLPHQETDSAAAPKKGNGEGEGSEPRSRSDKPAAAAADAADAASTSPSKNPKGMGPPSSSLTALAASKPTALPEKAADPEQKKLTLWQKVKREAHHYWDGSKLLATEVKISWRLALKMAAGYELSRRESRQLRRTVQDLGRLVPFSVFIIVPAGELFLPLALRLFPNMLPSTYEGDRSREKKANLLRATRKEVSGFLQTTLRETGLPLSPATARKEEFSNFFRKVRSTGEKPTDEDVIRVCKAFRDDLTLDNLSRPQLVSMCRYMNLSTFGTDLMLRYQIRHRMRQIKRDDRAISFEGVDVLTVAELQTACASRGIRTHSVSVARMRRDLQTWLDLRLREGVPSTLLVMSNAYMYNQHTGEDGSQIEALVGVLSAIPEELYHEIELEVHTAQGEATNRLRLEVLKEQEELILDENEQTEETEGDGFATPRDLDNIDEQDDRQVEAQTKGVGTQPVKEMIHAEKETVEAEAAAAADDDRTTGSAEQAKKKEEAKAE